MKYAAWPGSELSRVGGGNRETTLAERQLVRGPTSVELLLVLNIRPANQIGEIVRWLTVLALALLY
ncbi:hypothetical protein, partial [uncultured Serratia sp.]|uniref:hypothetical protein n=1 Tax=uncultured Serratia sp. TaxID=239175 RepID=UPI0025988BCB